MKRNSAIALLLAFCFSSAITHAQSLITISPAALSLKGHAGQSSTQNFKVSNLTDTLYSFNIEVTDVLVENGARRFIPAGQSAGSIAALAVLPVKHVELQPGQETSV